MTRVKQIGISADPKISFGRTIITGVARYALEAGDWELDTTGGVPYLSQGRVMQWRGDGMVGVIGPRLARALRARKIPFVNISSVLTERIRPSVVIDNRAVGTMAAEHLLAKGFRRFALACDSERYHMRLRREAFEQRLASEGCSCRAFAVERLAEDEETIDFKVDELAGWLVEQGEPVGVFGVQDPIARSVIRRCLQRGLHVPEDVGVMGEGNWHFVCDMVTPRLTSIDIGAERIGYQAARLLDEMLAGRASPKEPILLLPVGVVQRQSTDVLAIEDESVRDALRFIRANAHAPVQIPDVLADVPVARSTLEKRFRRILGRSIHEEIRRARVERACALLTETDMSIKRISAACGYATQDRFNFAFKRERKTTPLAYRKTHRAG